MSLWFKSSFIALMIVGLTFLAACGNRTPETKRATSPETDTKTAADHAADDGHDHTHDGHDHAHEGESNKQTIETDSYHLEFLPIVTTDGVQLDFHLQDEENHQSIHDAEVTAHIEFPDGERKSLKLTYDSADKGYTAFLPAQMTGEYKVAIQTDIKGEKVNGRFQFDR